MSWLTQININHHSYGSIRAIDGCNILINQNDLIAIIGPNGGGKSTLVKLIAGLFEPTSGKITHNNLEAVDIAYLAQRNEIDRTFPLKVKDVIAMGLWPKIGARRGFTPVDHHRINDILDMVGLAGFENRSISQLSGGQLQRLFFGRVMAQDAQLILLDEPFSGIDQPTVTHLLALIKDWHAQGKTIIAVLHDIPIVRQAFPQTALIAKSLVAYDKTEHVLTLENLARATFNV